MSKFYKCSVCGQMVGKIKESACPIMCCGKPMEHLEANTTEAAFEKHIPDAKVEDNIVKVQVGSVTHPMLEEHYIEWIYLETDKGGARKVLKPGDAPEVCFALCDETPKAVYAYCNLHGLWKKDL